LRIDLEEMASKLKDEGSTVSVRGARKTLGKGLLSHQDRLDTAWGASIWVLSTLNGREGLQNGHHTTIYMDNDVLVKTMLESETQGGRTISRIMK
jgi:hypothetical protein